MFWDTTTISFSPVDRILAQKDDATLASHGNSTFAALNFQYGGQRKAQCMLNIISWTLLCKILREIFGCFYWYHLISTVVCGVINWACTAFSLRKPLISLAVQQSLVITDHVSCRQHSLLLPMRLLVANIPCCHKCWRQPLVFEVIANCNHELNNELQANRQDAFSNFIKGFSWASTLTPCTCAIYRSEIRR